MTIKQQGGIFGRNPSFNQVEANSADINGLLKVSNEHNLNFIQLSSSTTADEAFVKLASTDLVIDHDPTGARSSSDIVLNSDGVEVLRIKNGASGGDLEPRGNVVLADGQGIDFSATSGTGTSELFDDYEEGNWTPSYTPTTGSFTTMTYNNQEGYYTKIGDLVYINCLISTNNSNFFVCRGVLLISGLPYTCGASADHSLAISGAVNWGGDYPLVGQVIESSSTIKFQYRTAVNGTTSSLDVSDMATSTSNNRNYIRFSGCYKV